MNFIQSETKLAKSLLPFQSLTSEICPAMSIMNLFDDTQSSRKRYVSFSASDSLLTPPSQQQPPDTTMISPGSTYDDFPSPDFPTAPRDRDNRDKELPTPARFGRMSEDRDRPPSGGARPRRSQDDQNPPMVGRRGDDPYNEAPPNDPLFDRDPYAPSRRKP